MACAQRSADRDLALPGHAASQHQIGYIGAGNKPHDSHNSYQRQQCRTRLLDQSFSIWRSIYPAAFAPNLNICRVPGNKPAFNPAQFRAHCRWTCALWQTPDRLIHGCSEVSDWLEMSGREFGGNPYLRILVVCRKEKPFRHYADDRVPPIIDPDLLANHFLIRSQQSAPHLMAHDNYIGVARLLLALKERASQH